jgi:hypothetical protein
MSQGGIEMKKIMISAIMLAAMAATGLIAEDHKDKDSKSFQFDPNSLVLSRSVYTGNANTVVVGQTLPPDCAAGKVMVPLLAGGPPAIITVKCAAAVDNGEYPNLLDNHNVFNNDGPDSSFGVTSPIFLDNLTTEGNLLRTLPVPTDHLVTSFSSKSELAVNLSTDGKSITFVGYHGGPGFVTGPNILDVSNSNTPGVIDLTNPVVSQYYRSVAEVDAHGNIQFTDGNAYSGNNGRAGIKANGFYYLTGNDNNGGLSTSQLTGTQIGLNLITSTGAELLVPNTPAPLPPNINMLGNFAIAQAGYPPPPDKPGKDNNFRGLTIFNNTMYVTKGSGGNGINTVYQVGTAGTLPTPANAPGAPPDLKKEPITVLNGFPTTLASGVGLDGKGGHPVMFPFGIWFADATTLYVCDEGSGTFVPNQVINGQVNVADTGTLATAGVQKWRLINGTWTMQYVLQDGLNLGIPYSVANYPAALSPATGGCRNLTGRRNGEGTVTIYAVTSTLSANVDEGADPNKLVKVTDLLKATSLPTHGSNQDKGIDDGNGWGHFTTIRSAQAGEVLRGISFAPSDQNGGEDENQGKDD